MLPERKKRFILCLHTKSIQVNIGYYSKRGSDLYAILQLLSTKISHYQ